MAMPQRDNAIEEIKRLENQGWDPQEEWKFDCGIVLFLRIV